MTGSGGTEIWCGLTGSVPTARRILERNMTRLWNIWIPWLRRRGSLPLMRPDAGVFVPAPWESGLPGPRFGQDFYRTYVSIQKIYWKSSENYAINKTTISDHCRRADLLSIFFLKIHFPICLLKYGLLLVLPRQGLSYNGFRKRFRELSRMSGSLRKRGGRRTCS